ncbi:MAG: DUF58 domain-containing protein [Elusimicrobiaceae bacterium]|nr:DUF58 domain-containing protein [Elusimicrobiaceae bacterium]
MKYIDNAAIARIQKLGRVRIGLDSVQGMAGPHKSAEIGFGQEFVQHRQYSRGDSVRFLDWKVFARTDRMYVKQFQEEKNLKICLLVDGSASMDFRSPLALYTKWEYACRLAMALSALFILQGDSCGVCVLKDRISLKTRPGNTLSSLEEFDGALGCASPSGKGDMRRAISDFLSGGGRGCAAVLLTDLLEENDAALRAALALKTPRNSATVLHLSDPAERRLHWSGRTELRDMEDNSRLDFDPAVFSGEYEREFARWSEFCRVTLNRTGIGCLPCSTDAPVVSVLERIAAMFARR